MSQGRSKRDRLLEGEDPESLLPQDTRHWISVYREMLAFKEDLLERVISDLGHVSAAAKTAAILDAGYELSRDTGSHRLEAALRAMRNTLRACRELRVESRRQLFSFHA